MRGACNSIPAETLIRASTGTGKTLVARALAASASRAGRKVAFFMRKGADVLSKWVGEAERQLRLLFEEAARHQPSIIFFDEIDGLAPVRLPGENSRCPACCGGILPPICSRHPWPPDHCAEPHGSAGGLQGSAC